MSLREAVDILATYARIRGLHGGYIMGVRTSMFCPQTRPKPMFSRPTCQ